MIRNEHAHLTPAFLHRYLSLCDSRYLFWVGGDSNGGYIYQAHVDGNKFKRKTLLSTDDNSDLQSIMADPRTKR